MKKITFLLTAIIFSINCLGQKIEVSGYNPKDSTKYKMNIIEKGDPYSYDALSVIYDLDPLKILPYALIMSEIHNDKRFDIDVYMGLFSVIERNKDIDKEKKAAVVSLALYYLKEVLKTKNFTARLDLEKMYREGNYVEKNEAAADYLKSGGYDIDSFLNRQHKEKK